MNPTPIQQFHYQFQNILAYQFSMDHIVEAAIWVVGGVVLALILYFAIRLLALSGIIQQEKKAFARKKRLLDDLVMMKDIQTELEKEIEQAILKSAFQS